MFVFNKKSSSLCLLTPARWTITSQEDVNLSREFSSKKKSLLKSITLYFLTCLIVFARWYPIKPFLPVIPIFNLN